MQPVFCEHQIVITGISCQQLTGFGSQGDHFHGIKTIRLGSRLHRGDACLGKRLPVAGSQFRGGKVIPAEPSRIGCVLWSQVLVRGKPNRVGCGLVVRKKIKGVISRSGVCLEYEIAILAGDIHLDHIHDALPRGAVVNQNFLQFRIFVTAAPWNMHPHRICIGVDTHQCPVVSEAILRPAGDPISQT